MRRSHIHVYTYTYVHTHTHVCIHLYVYVYVYIHVFMRVCIYTSASRLPSRYHPVPAASSFFFGYTYSYHYSTLLTFLFYCYILLLHTLGRCGWKRQSVAHRSHSVRDQGQTRRARGYIRGVLHSQSCHRRRAAGAPLWRRRRGSSSCKCRFHMWMLIVRSFSSTDFSWHDSFAYVTCRIHMWYNATFVCGCSCRWC